MPGFGEGLKRERERKGISLEEVAMATKIGTRMLRAIEEEQFEKLPGGIFNKGFVRAYARHLGMDEDEAVADYLETLRAREPEPEPVPVSERKEITVQERLLQLGAMPRVRLAVALLIGALGLVLWAASPKNTTEQASPPPPEPETIPVAATSKIHRKSETAPRREKLDQSHGVIAASDTARLEPAEPEVTRQAQDPAISATPAGMFLVRIQADEDSWLLITADGQPIMEDTLSAEKVKLVGAQKELVIKAGNVGGLQFWFNGNKLPLQGEADEVKTLTFGRTGLVTSAARMQPGPAQLLQ